MQAKSIINNRIFLDTNHFISDKLFFYKKFANEEFCPQYMPFETMETINFLNEPIILKSGNGYSSEGIKILQKYNKNDIIEHINKFQQFKNWTVSKIYIPRLWNNFIVTNRIYFLVTRL